MHSYSKTNPFHLLPSSAKLQEYGDDQEHKESISRDTCDAPVSPVRPLYHQETVVSKGKSGICRSSTETCEGCSDFRRTSTESHTG